MFLQCGSRVLFGNCSMCSDHVHKAPALNWKWLCIRVELDSFRSVRCCHYPPIDHTWINTQYLWPSVWVPMVITVIVLIHGPSLDGWARCYHTDNWGSCHFMDMFVWMIHVTKQAYLAFSVFIFLRSDSNSKQVVISNMFDQEPLHHKVLHDHLLAWHAEIHCWCTSSADPILPLFHALFLCRDSSN